MTQKKLGVIIDFDNTLVNTWGFVLRHLKNTCTRLGVPVPQKSDVMRILKKNPPFENIFNELFGPLADKILKAYRENAMNTDYTPTEGAIQFIKILYEKDSIIMIASNRVNKLSNRLVQAGFNPDWFHTILQMAEPKPSLKAYNEALDYFKSQNIKNNNIYILGDSIDDYKACSKDMRGKFFAVTTGANTKTDFLKAGVKNSHILRSLNELKI